MKDFKNKKGVTLLELLMVVGIAATISVSALVFFKATDESNKVSMEAKSIGTLASGIASMFSGQGHYTGLSNATVVSSNVLPDSMRGPGTTDIKHSWNASGVTVAPDRVTSTTYDDVFVITYTSVPDKSCVDLMSKTFSVFATTTINGTSFTTVTEIPPLCNAGLANVLTWTR